MKTINVGLTKIKGVGLPVNAYILDDVENMFDDVDDISYDVIRENILNICDRENGLVFLNIYTTGFTPAMFTVVNICNNLGIPFAFTKCEQCVA